MLKALNALNRKTKLDTSKGQNFLKLSVLLGTKGDDSLMLMCLKKTFMFRKRQAKLQGVG